jgi:hypothetical protein
MRLVSIRPGPIARIVAVVYAFLGLVIFVEFALSSSEYLTLPFGVLAIGVHLNLNLNLPRSSNPYYNIFLCIACVLSYALTGWITGAVATLCFNAVSNKLGGIDSKYFSFVDETKVTNEQAKAQI